MDGGHGSINHALTSIWMAFLGKSNSDKVYMKFKKVDFLVASIQFSNQRFLLVRTGMITLMIPLLKDDAVQDLCVTEINRSKICRLLSRKPHDYY